MKTIIRRFLLGTVMVALLPNAYTNAQSPATSAAAVVKAADWQATMSRSVAGNILDTKVNEMPVEVTPSP